MITLQYINANEVTTDEPMRWTLKQYIYLNGQSNVTGEQKNEH